jgi:hypothetical protein
MANTGYVEKLAFTSPRHFFGWKVAQRAGLLGVAGEVKLLHSSFEVLVYILSVLGLLIQGLYSFKSNMGRF